MTQTPFHFFRRPIGILCLILLSACASTVPAPLENRSPQPLATAEPGYYTVQKGDTLYSIALRHSQDYKEIAAWNGLSDAGVISVGQVLRVQPLENMTGSGVSTAPVVTGAIAEQSLESANTLKREPMVNKEPYSDAAYAKAQGTSANDGPKPAATTASISTPASTPAATATASGLIWIWPAKGKTVGNFSSTKGIDISGQAGAPVLAAADGKVVYAGSGLRGYGQLVIIKHSDLYLTAYAHNQKILVKENQEIKRGTRIAEMGKTDSDSVKLHFEIRKQGKPVDPLGFLPKQ